MKRFELRLRKMESVVVKKAGGPKEPPSQNLMTVTEAREAMAELNRDIDAGAFPAPLTSNQRVTGRRLIQRARAIEVKPEWLEYGFDSSHLSQAERLAIGFAIRDSIVQSVSK